MASRSRRDGIARTAERTTMLGLVACGTVLIFVPLVLTLYLSVFDEQLIMFPPRGYTLRWYPAIIPQFAGPLLTSVELATASMVGSLLRGMPAGIRLAPPRSPRRRPGRA